MFAPSRGATPSKRSFANVEIRSMGLLEQAFFL
jgi:hypothetical protein